MFEQKTAVLQRLQELDRPASISEINAALGMPERTLRRLLQQLAAEGQLLATGERRGRRYALPADTTNHREGARTAAAPGEQGEKTSDFFSPESWELIAKVRQPLIKRAPCTYRFEWLDEYEPNATYYLNREQRARLSSAGRRLTEEVPAGTYARKIFNRLLIDLSYNSSRLEGNTYSLVDTEKLVLEGEFPEGKLDVEKVMILNHKEAIRFLVDGINRLEINLDNVRTLHYLLADGLIAPGDAGRIRSDGVRVSSTTYMPIEGRERLEAQLTRLVNTAARILDPFEQSFFLLVHVAYLQAFVDVNKRTSRLAANIPLVRHNLVPLSFSDISKDDYASAVIVAYEFNETGPLAELYVGSYLRSCEQYSVAAEAVGVDTLRVVYRQQRRDLIAEIVTTRCCGKELRALVERRMAGRVPPEHREKFLDDLRLDLEGLAPFSIAGMGITAQDLDAWKDACAANGLGL